MTEPSSAQSSLQSTKTRFVLFVLWQMLVKDTGQQVLTVSVKGVDAMYDFIGQYKYYKKTLPRSVALDVVIAALTRLMPKKK